MAEYSRLLNLDDETKQKLINYLVQELTNHESERGAFLDELDKIRLDYIATPKGPNNFPFKNAANVVIPIVAITFETVHARSMTTHFGIDQIVSAKATTSAWSDLEQGVQDSMNFELRRSNFELDVEDALIELEKFGTGIARVKYEKIIKYIVREANGQEEEFPVVLREGCKIEPISSSAFVMPFTEQDCDLAPWCGHESLMTAYELEVHEQSGLFEEGTKDKLLNLWSPSQGWLKSIEVMEEKEGRIPSLPERIRVFELWTAFDTDDTGNKKEIIVYFHYDSNTIMGVRYNTHDNGERNFRYGNYLKLEHRWNGIGIGKQVQQFQEEITAIHRQRLDAGTIANIPMFKMANNTEYGPDEPIYPGKIWFLNNMQDFDVIQLGRDVPPSAFNNEFQTLNYAQQRGGANEAVLGMPQTGTPGTASSDLARIQEGNKKWDYSFGNEKRFLSQLITDFAVCLQQYGPRHIEYYAEGNNGKIMQKWLSLPQDSLRNNVLIELRTAGQQSNKILDRQNWQQIAVFLKQYYTDLLMLAQQGAPQVAPLIMQKAFVASTEALVQILETFNVRNIDRIAMTELLNGSLAGIMGQQPQASAGQSPEGAGPPQATGAPPPQRLLQAVS